MSTMFRDISSVDAMPSHIEPPSRIFGLSAGKTTFRPSLLSQDTSRLNMQFGNSNNVDYMSDQRQRTSVVQSTTLGVRSFGLQSRNLTSHSTMVQEGTRLNQNIQQRSNNTSAISKPFWPAVRNTTLTTGLQVQDSLRYNDDMIDSDGFRRPSTLSIIRGRNSTLSSRLFHNSDRHYRDLSNINGFNVSHISRRDVSTMSESRLPLGMKSSWMENQSLSGSVISAVSMKAQFMNLLENLHHSILSIGPNVTADAVRMEFDKAKQGLENISEMSFAPTVKPTDTASVVSHTSKSNCAQINGEPVASNTLDGGSLHLKSSKDLLKTLISNKNNYRRKFNLSTHVEEEEQKEGAITSTGGGKESEGEGEEEDSSSLVFKKPRPYVRKKPTRMKIRAPPAEKNLPPKGGVVNKVINLKQWYPIAVGSNLAFCGVDEKGASVKTDAVKKRLSNRKVELITGLGCNLIGSPSTMVSVLPQKIVTLLKNGLTDRWRVLQRELLDCQTAEEETRRRKSKSPKTKSPTEKAAEARPKGRAPKKGNSGRPRVLSTPKKKSEELHTRSGRSVKRPGMFWLANGSNEVSSSLELSETTIQDPPKKTWRKSNERSPAKKPKSASPSKRYKKASPSKKPKSSPKISKKEQEESPSRKEKLASPAKTKSGEVESSPKKSSHKKGNSPVKKNKRAKDPSPNKSKKPNEESSRKKYKRTCRGSPGRGVASPAKAESSPKKSRRKVKSPKGRIRKESEEEAKVHSSTEEAKQQSKSRSVRGKRKREVVADADSVEAKKSKIEKETEVEVESTVKSSEPTKRGRKKIGLSTITRSPKPKGKKSPQAKNKKQTAKKKTVKNALENQNNTTEFTEFEKNFDFKLDDIEIPELANVSGNPQLSRSQLRLVSMETPPLKYFNSNLKLLGCTTPMRSPDWCISQRTESEVKQFQRRREEAFKKKVKVDIKKTVVKEKNGQNKDVKRVMEWVAEKTVRSPQWSSKVLQYVIPSRKQMEEQDEEDVDAEFF